MKNKIFLLLTVISGMLGITSCFDDEPNWAEGTPSPIIAIIDLRFMNRGTEPVALTPEKLAGAHQMVGVVISDAAAGNAPNGNLVIQNQRRGGLRGLVIDVSGANYTPGDSVMVDISGTTLTRESGVLTLKGVTPDDVQKVGESMIFTNPVTLAQLKANPELYEGTLVQIAGSVSPLPVSGEVYGGDKKLTEGTETLIMHTEPASALAQRRLPASATYTGIFLRDITASTPGEEVVGRFWVRTPADVTNASGPIYGGWPENFDALDASVKNSYDMNPLRGVEDNTVTLSTGPWKMYQAILGNTANDEALSKPNSVRMQQNLSVPALLEMKFDVPNGATKVTLWPMVYDANADKPCLWKLEYSQDQGATWTQVGEDQLITKKDRELYTFLMDIRGPVRFRIFKYGPGNGATDVSIQNGRLSIDDFAIYENPQ